MYIHIFLTSCLIRQHAVVSILFLLCLGMIFFDAGTLIIVYSARGLLVHPVNLFFAGALIATVSWVSACIPYIRFECKINRLRMTLIPGCQLHAKHGKWHAHAHSLRFFRLQIMRNYSLKLYNYLHSTQKQLSLFLLDWSDGGMDLL